MGCIYQFIFSSCIEAATDDADAPASRGSCLDEFDCTEARGCPKDVNWFRDVFLPSLLFFIFMRGIEKFF